MHCTTADRAFSRNLPRAVLGLLVLAALGSVAAAPGHASADAPELTPALAVAAMTDRLADDPILHPRPPVVVASFLDRISEVLKDGVQVASGRDGQAAYVHFKQRGFGGVLLLRYRR